MVRALTGIQPSGPPHIGNLKGMVEPAVGLQESTEPFYFIASYHAMTTLRDPVLFRQYQLEAAATFLAFGLDPKRAALFRQQDIPEVCELSWILSTHINMGILERAHAFKSAKDKGKEINLGTFSYPVLMAADILLYDTNLVPVGKDQKQHVEMARDFAAGFNHRYDQEIFVLPSGTASVGNCNGRHFFDAMDDRHSDRHGGDFWRSRGEGGVWHRIHTKPRRSLFTPFKVAKGPEPSEKLRGTRFTKGVTRSGQIFEFHDNWQTPDNAHRLLDEYWVGCTTFVVKSKASLSDLQLGRIAPDDDCGDEVKLRWSDILE